VKTLAVRMERQQANADQIAQWLEAHGFKVRYPGLRSHPQYELHRSMARGAGAVLSFETGNVKVSERIVEACRIWGISVSFGCVNSLIRFVPSESNADVVYRVKCRMPRSILRLVRKERCQRI
jgi:cystathionine beta-lyase